MSRTFTTIEEPRQQLDNSELIEPGEFPLDALPGAMRTLAASLSDVHQIDVALPAMAALATLSGAIGKSVTVSGAVNGRDTHCNLFIIAGAPKSYGKGAASTAAKPIVDASAEVLKHFMQYERADLQTEVELLEGLKKKQLKECSSMMEESGTCDKARLSETNAELERNRWLLETKARPGYHVGACTGAALEEHLVRNDETAFSFSPEAGDMVRIALGRYSKDGSGDFDLFLSGYSVEHYSSGRVGRGFNSLTPCLSSLWMCQPSLLRELYSSAEGLERGLTARVLAFCCEHEIIPEDDGIPREVDRVALEVWSQLISDTLDGREAPRILHTDRLAREAFRQWHNEGVTLRNGLLRDVEGEAGRWRENAIRIAGVLAVASGAVRITEGLAKDAIRLCRWAVFSGLSLLASGRSARQLEQKSKLQTMLGDGPVTVRNLHRRHGFSKSSIKHLADAYPNDFILETVKPESAGRPSEIVRLK
jgi:hypothetical protein